MFCLNLPDRVVFSRRRETFVAAIDPREQKANLVFASRDVFILCCNFQNTQINVFSFNQNKTSFMQDRWHIILRQK